ncbi:hypothetical protein [Actinoplanes sp. NPDC051411]|uniref:hypothetical protein n=1 Tax=Actinoplanes sp. NPDC051411 TaxID=3155522 RepID=UPI00341F7B54
MPDAPLEFVVVEPAGYCDPETGLCVPEAEEAPDLEPEGSGSRRRARDIARRPSSGVPAPGRLR